MLSKLLSSLTVVFVCVQTSRFPAKRDSVETVHGAARRRSLRHRETSLRSKWTPKLLTPLWVRFPEVRGGAPPSARLKTKSTRVRKSGCTRGYHRFRDTLGGTAHSLEEFGCGGVLFWIQVKSEL